MNWGTTNSYLRNKYEQGSEKFLSKKQVLNRGATNYSYLGNNYEQGNEKFLFYEVMHVART
jgi:hypothetical protein